MRTTSVRNLLQDVDGLLAVGHTVRFETKLAQQPNGDLLAGYVVLGDQNARLSPAELWRDTSLLGGASVALPDCFSRDAVNQNVDPCPSLLSTPTSPPISSASCLEIASPRPVPPNRRVVDEST